MQRPKFVGRSFLIVEDEPLIVMDITRAFEGTGAAMTTTNTLTHALVLVENDGLSAAILDYYLGHENSSPLCTRLKERQVIYSGINTIEGLCANALHVSKPASSEDLLTAMQNPTHFAFQ